MDQQISQATIQSVRKKHPCQPVSQPINRPARQPVSQPFLQPIRAIHSSIEPHHTLINESIICLLRLIPRGSQRVLNIRKLLKIAELFTSPPLRTECDDKKDLYFCWRKREGKKYKCESSSYLLFFFYPFWWVCFSLSFRIRHAFIFYTEMHDADFRWSFFEVL